MTESLWDFSNRVYRLDGVPDACLRLQDRHGADVNVVLFCCWAGVTVGVVPEPTMRDALNVSTEWTDHVVGPLRRARTWMKQHHGESPLRDRIKQVELDAEQAEQRRLERLVADRPEPGPETVTDTGPGRDAVVENLDRWLTAAGISLDDAGRSDVDLVVGATLGNGLDATGGT